MLLCAKLYKCYMQAEGVLCTLTNASQFYSWGRKALIQPIWVGPFFLATLFCLLLFSWSQGVMAICSRWRSSDSFTKCELLLPFVLLSTLSEGECSTINDQVFQLFSNISLSLWIWFDLREFKLVWLLRRLVIFLKIYRVFRFDFRFQTFVIAKTSYWPKCSINIFHWEKTKNCWQPTSNWNNGSFEVH